MRLSLILCALLLASCSQPYWHRDMPEGWKSGGAAIAWVKDTAPWCGPKADGCTQRLISPPMSLVYIREDLTRDRKACVLLHEILGHDAGYGHAEGMPDNCRELPG